MKQILYILFAILLAGCSPKGENGVYDVTKFGAKGNGTADDAKAIQKAIDAAGEAGGGVVLFPAGKTFMSGPLHLRSNLEIRLEEGAVLLANPDESIYHESAFKANEGEGMMWISGKDLKNLKITGLGAIDGNGVAFMGDELYDSYDLKPVTTFDPRPHLLTLINVDSLEIKDVTIGNSAYWTIHLIGCTNAWIHDMSVLNNVKIRNSDGIDVDHSKNVVIENCIIESGDDCVCLKNRREYEEYGPCYNVEVTNCTMTSRSCAIKIGSENMDSIYNVRFRKCDISNSNRGIGIQNRDEGTVTDVIFEDMNVQCSLYSDVWWGKAEPIYVTSFPRPTGDHKDANWRFPKGAIEGSCGEVSNITFRNINCESENGCFIGGDVPGKVNHINFDKVNIKIVGAGLPNDDDLRAANQYDLRPVSMKVCEGFITDDVVGFYVYKATDLTFEDCKVDGVKFKKEWNLD